MRGCVLNFQLEYKSQNPEGQSTEQTSCLEALYKIASKGWHVDILLILFLKTTLLFYLLLRAFL